MYKAILFAPDGEFVTDYEAGSIAEVWQRIEDGGSRWYFYPFPFVITADERLLERKRILASPHGLEMCTGRTVRKVQRFIESNSETLLSAYC